MGELGLAYPYHIVSLYPLTECTRLTMNGNEPMLKPIPIIPKNGLCGTLMVVPPGLTADGCD